MPAFAKVHPPDDIWRIVAFVRHLPALTPDERQELARGAPGELPAGGAVPPGQPTGGAGPAASARPGSADEHVHQVAISRFEFVPSTLRARVGDFIEWKNQDFAVHTATADDRSFDSGDIQADGTKRVVVRKKGQFPYSCRYHPAMKGSLVVE